MSYGGIAIWDVKHVEPHSHDEAMDMEQDIANLPADNHPGFKAVAQALQHFAKDASEYYDYVDMYLDIDAERQLEGPVVWYGEVDPDLTLAFSAVIAKTALEHGLVAMYNDVEMVFLPDGRTYLNNKLIEDGVDSLDYQLNQWQRKLKQLKREAQTVDKLPYLPANGKLIEKEAAKIVKSYLKEHKLPVVKTRRNEIVYVADFERVQVELLVAINTRRIESKSDEEREVGYKGYCTIYLNDVSKSISWHDKRMIGKKSIPLGLNQKYILTHQEYYYNIVQDSRDEIKVKSMSALQDNIVQTLDMFKAFCDVADDLNALYDFVHSHYTQNKPNQPLQDRDSLRIEQVLFLAKLTKQPNYAEVVEFYRPQIANKLLLHKLRHARKRREITQAQLEQATTLPAIVELLEFPDETLAVFDELYNEFIEYLDTLDVDAILSTPPYKNPALLKLQ